MTLCCKLENLHFRVNPKNFEFVLCKQEKALEIFPNNTKTMSSHLR